MEKTKGNSYFCGVLLLLMVISSCTSEIEFNEGLLEPKLVVNGICSLDSIIEIEVSLSKPIYGYVSDFEYISNANVVLYIDGEQEETLKFDSSNVDDASYRGNTVLEEGKKYKVEVNYDDFEKAVSSEMEIGQKVPILYTEVNVPDGGVESGTTFTIESVLSFSDPASEENYYKLDILYRIGKSNTYIDSTGNESLHVTVTDYCVCSQSLESNDPVLVELDNVGNVISESSSSRHTLFTDDLFNGEKYDLSFFLDNSVSYKIANIDTSTGGFYMIIFELQSLTEDTYLYLKSSGLLDNLTEGLFTEPVQVYNNITNGLGIWGGYSFSTDTVQYGVYPRADCGYSYGSVSY